MLQLLKVVFYMGFDQRMEVRRAFLKQRSSLRQRFQLADFRRVCAGHVIWLHQSWIRSAG
jgi:hypothetical protein